MVSKWTVRAVVAVGIVVAVVLFVGGRSRAQGNDPQAAVKAWYAALKAGDFNAAAAQVEGIGGPAETAEFIRAFQGWTGINVFGYGPTNWLGPLTACESNLKNLSVALEMYSTDNSGRFPRSVGALTPNYMRSIPTCPAARADTYSAGFTSVSNPDGYTVVCSGTNHAAEGQTANYPQYTSTRGLLASTAMQQRARPIWAPLSYRVLGQSGGGDNVVVRVEETYELYGFPTRVFARILLHRSGGAWKIDAPGMARALDVSTVVTATVKARQGTSPSSRARLAAWLRLQGFGPSFAALAGAMSLSQIRDLLNFDALSSCKSNLKNIGTALEMYSTDNQGRFPISMGALAPNYLKMIPTCPSAAQDTYSGAFVSASNPDAYTVICHGQNHARAGLQADFPQYTSTQGLLDR